MTDMIPEEIADQLQKHFGNGFKIMSASALSGGCINHAFKVTSNKGVLFLKYNLSDRYPGMFESEAKGLMLMSSLASLRIPDVILQSAIGIYDFLVLEYMEPGHRSATFSRDFGHSLANMHKESGPQFGLDHNNYIGSLPQDNRPMKDLYEFFIVRRLEPMVKIARDHGILTGSDQRIFDSFYKALPGLIPPEGPALLHGDLWSGNFLVDNHGNAALIDPAVYYGHRESDLAMSKLFGGFDPDFYAAYHESFPLEKGWEGRMDYYNVYPLMVHVNLFGGGYLRSVKDILREF